MCVCVCVCEAVTSLSHSMSLGGEIDQDLLDALEAAYKEVATNLLCLGTSVQPSGSFNC